MTLNVGDKVEVKFTGVVEEVRHDVPLGIRHIVRSDGSGNAHALFDHAKGTDFKVVKVDPKNWPPQPGDVWKGDKGTYFARREAYSMDVGFYSDTVGKGGEEPAHVLRDNPKLRLVYRNFA